MKDLRWIDVTFAVDSAVRHFSRGVDIYRERSFEGEGLDGYVTQQAFMGAIRSGHHSLEAAIERILSICGEDLPAGPHYHADIIRRASLPIDGERPAILSKELASAADETRRFRHRATHDYDNFDHTRVEPTVIAAELLSKLLHGNVDEFRVALEADRKDESEHDGGGDGAGGGAGSGP